jgi:hypothetical protein
VCPGFESLIRHHFFHPLESPAVKLVKCLVLAAALLAPAAQAQLRTVPAEAKAGSLRHLQDMIVELDGKPARLSPGAQIRDTFNRLVLPASLVDKTTVKYLKDPTGMVHRVWILSPEEVAQIPKPKPPVKKDEKKDEEKAKD